ncbi:hypothetical protein EC988_001641 [Linderina pennispora]|nr:hypothetical protein EC988_001641 [Linderina pennispora]
MTEAKPYDINSLKVNPAQVLDSCSARQVCDGCGRRMKFFCYYCYKPVADIAGKVPQIRLPFKLTVLKHPGENDGKSTALHAKVIAPEDVQVTIYSEDVLSEIDTERTVLLFPGPDATDISEVDLASYDHAIVIDGTWQQARGMVRKDSKLHKIPKVTIKPRKTRFWRFQKYDESYLATIEAIYFLYRDSRGEAYEGEYDALMYFYKYFYDLIQNDYAANTHKTFTHRHQEGYISYETATPRAIPRTSDGKQWEGSGIQLDDAGVSLGEMLQDTGAE